MVECLSAASCGVELFTSMMIIWKLTLYYSLCLKQLCSCWCEFNGAVACLSIKPLLLQLSINLAIPHILHLYCKVCQIISSLWKCIYPFLSLSCAIKWVTLVTKVKAGYLTYFSYNKLHCQKWHQCTETTQFNGN